MSRALRAVPLTPEGFAPFGEVIAPRDAPSVMINRGKCERHHALALADVVGEGARVAINIFRGTPYAMPLTLDLMERHPLGSQCFMPMGPDPWLAVVATGDDAPEAPQAFVVPPHTGLNYPRGLWHAVLTPIGRAADFLVIDRDGPGDNLTEHWFDDPWTVHLPS